jgi:choline dehydrogenase-like flavoprotein
MIEDARQIKSGACLKADLCILGGGAAAISLCLEFMKSGRSVILIPGGGTSQTASCIDLYRGKVSPEQSHEPLEENRIRMWGGTTTVWGGRCVPYDAIDFQRRDWIADSGWPINLNGLEPYLEKAIALSEAGSADFDARSVFPNTQHEIFRGFDNEDFASWKLERWSIPTDYSRRYRADIESAENVRVLLHAHGIHLQLEENANSIKSVRVACSPGREFIIEATNTVIACGALENARLLLAARDVAPAGIGNSHDLVGRFYQSHRFGVCGYAVLKDTSKSFIYDFEKDSDGVYCRRRFWLTDVAQERHKICNVVGFFFRNVSGNSEHRNAMVSLIMLIKTLLGGAKNGPRRLLQIIKDQRRELISHAWIVLKDGPSILGQLSAVAYTRFFQKRRLPMILPPKKSNRFPLFYQSEHAPLYDSRVTLDLNSKDEFGMPRLDVQIRFSEVDHLTVKTFVEQFKKRIEESGVGKFHLSKDDLDLLNNPDKHAFNSNSHNIGTTRMATEADKGVVDTNCKVFGVDNLYVAGSSVFPTSSHANPTLMIIALALRLADHLKTKQS